MSLIVFGGSASADLAWEVVKSMKADHGRLDIKQFPDGEICTKLETDVKGRDCVVIQSTRTNDNIVELLLTLDLLRDYKAKEIHVVAPYMGYCRQDKRFVHGECLSIKTILNLIDEKADSITTVNAHFLNEEGEYSRHGVTFQNLDVLPKITEYLGTKAKKPIIIAPDKGSQGYAKRAAEQLDCKFDHLSKKRISGEEVIIKKKTLDVSGMDVIMLDDIISTGGTILKASEVIKSWKPSSVNVGCVHGLFLNGLEPFQGKVDRIVCTNTLQTPISKVSVADEIAKALR